MSKMRGNSLANRNSQYSRSVTPNTSSSHASGDNTVDAVDNSPAVEDSPVSDGERSADAEHGVSTSAGYDIASAALRSARQAARSRPSKSRSSSTENTGHRRRRRWSAARSDERDPQPLARLVSRMAADRGWSDRLAEGSVFGKWAALVGSEVAEHAKPITLRDGELTVQAESTAWATQLRLLQRQLLAGIAEGVGHGVVRKIKVRGPAAPSWRHGPKHISGRGPRDTYG